MRNFTPRRSDYLTDSVVHFVSGIHITERRNEWVNWDGDTSIVNRLNSHRFYLSLKDAKNDAERLRKQGTRFEIRSVPVICVANDDRQYVLGDADGSSPFYGIDKSLREDLEPKSSAIAKIQHTAKTLGTRRFGFVGQLTGVDLCAAEHQPTDLHCYRSSSMGANYRLAWSKIDDMNADAARGVFSALRS